LIDTGDIKKGVIIELDGQLMKVLDWTHIKMARGSAQVRMKLQNVRKGDIVERTFQAGTRWPRARVEQRRVMYLYSDGDAYHFMDNETYDQFTVSAAMLGDDARYLKENTEAFVSMYEGEVLGVDLPVTVDLLVNAGDRAGGPGAPVHQRGRHPPRRHPHRRVRHQGHLNSWTTSRRSGT
jgi:elongation factor P